MHDAKAFLRGISTGIVGGFPHPIKNPANFILTFEVKSVGFFVFGDCEIYKAEQTCICTGNENKGYPKGNIPLALGFQ